MSTVVAFFTLRLCETCVRRFESRLTTYKMLALNSSRPTFFCGRYGYSFWPIWSFRVADVVVADMVCGRYGTDPNQPWAASPAVTERLHFGRHCSHTRALMR